MNRSTLENIKKCADKAHVKIERIIASSKHIKVQVRGNKAGVVFVSATPSDYRAFQNVVSNMKKVGYIDV